MSGQDIAALQSAEGHQESAGEKSGFGLGHSDSIATITEGLKWFFTFHEGAIAAYNNVFEGLVGGLNKAIGGEGMALFGDGVAKMVDAVKQALGHGAQEGGGEGGEGGAPQDEGGEGHDSGNFPHLDDQMGHDWSGFAGGAHHDHDYRQGQSVSPDSSPSAGDDHGPALGT